MLQRTLLIIALITCSLASYSQIEDLPLGISSPRMVDQLMLSVPDIGRENMRSMLNEQNVKPFMMPPRNVSNNGDILSYTIATCMEYYINLETNYKTNLSPDFIGLSLKYGEGENTLEKGLKFVTKTGTVSASILPYGSTEINEVVYASKKYRIKNFLYIFSDLTQPRQKIFEIRKALIRGNPILAELKIDETFENLEYEEYWTPKFKNKDSIKEVPIIIVGYDKTKEACEILYCNGINWGTYGYAWVKFDLLAKHLQNGYVIAPE